MRVQSPRSKVQGRLLVRRVLLLCCFLAGPWTFDLGPWTSADAAARPRYGDTLRLSFSQTAETYDPAQAATLPERLLARSIYETLTSLPRGNRTGAGVEGRLAASWRAEAGGRRWIFNLRAGARFHSGNALTAAAARAAASAEVQGPRSKVQGPARKQQSRSTRRTSKRPWTLDLGPWTFAGAALRWHPLADARGSVGFIESISLQSRRSASRSPIE